MTAITRTSVVPEAAPVGALSALSCLSGVNERMGGKREKAGVGRMRCLRHSGPFFRWRANESAWHV